MCSEFLVQLAGFLAQDLNDSPEEVLDGSKFLWAILTGQFIRHRLLKRSEDRRNFAHVLLIQTKLDDRTPPVAFVSLAPDKTGCLQTVDDPGDGATCQSNQFRELSIDVIGKLVLNVIAVLGLVYLAWRIRKRKADQSVGA